jgi:hypothetical protein
MDQIFTFNIPPSHLYFQICPVPNAASSVFTQNFGGAFFGFALPLSS